MSVSAHRVRSIFIAILSLAFASSATAIPNFGNNAIGFQAIPGVAGVYTVTDNFATLTKTQLPNGFMVDYAYTITSVDGQTMVDITWTATRRFCLGVPAENLAVTISGSTTVSSNNAPTLKTADFVVNGTILGQNPDVDFFQNRPLANNMAINWNRTSNPANVPGANACYTLQMFSGPTWTPSAKGDTISFQSQYLIQVISAPGSPMPSPTPAPSPKPITIVPDQPGVGIGQSAFGIQRSFKFDASGFLLQEFERHSAVGISRYLLVRPTRMASVGNSENDGWAEIRHRYCTRVSG